MDSPPSTGKVTNEFENKVQKTAAFMAALKVRVEKTFLDKKHESLERWMNKSQQDSHRTVTRVCNKAESVIYDMVASKKRAMQDMVVKMGKKHEDELKQLKEETRNKTLREFIQNNGRYLDKGKLSRIVNLKTVSDDIKNGDPGVKESVTSIEESPQMMSTSQGMQVSGSSPRGETRISTRYPKEISSTKKTKIDDTLEKEPFCHTEMCLITSLNKPQGAHLRKGIKEPQDTREEVCVTISDPDNSTRVTCRFDSTRLSSMEDDRSDRSDEWSEYNTVEDKTPLFTCTACVRTSSEMLMCSRCMEDYYCNEDCQRKDWIEHQHNCTD
jgi:hypothetical protein